MTMFRRTLHKTLSREDVETIRALWLRGIFTAQSLAKQYGVSATQIGLIVRGLRRQKVAAR